MYMCSRSDCTPPAEIGRKQRNWLSRWHTGSWKKYEKYADRRFLNDVEGGENKTPQQSLFKFREKEVCMFGCYARACTDCVCRLARPKAREAMS